MATNHYFNNYFGVREQKLIDDLIVESIKIQGFDAYYVPNVNSEARDLVYGEDPLRTFTVYYPIEMYLSDANDYGGQREFFSKFGLEIRNNVSVCLSRRSFQERVPQTYARPREGDLVYIPFLNGTGELFEIKFTNQTKDFFMLGRTQPYFYELELEKFKYSQEVIATGTSELDDVVTNSGYVLSLNTGAGNANNFIVAEKVYQSADHTYANATTIATVQAWIPSSNTLQVSNINGEFVDGMVIIGNTSNAQFMLATFDPLNDPSYNNPYDNETIQSQANTYIVPTNNPLGTI